MAFVREVIAPTMASEVMLPVLGSQSTNTGLAFTHSTA
jgi:hypothetical protein